MQAKFSNHVPLDEKDVHVWFVDLRIASSSIRPLNNVLSCAEHRRSKKFKFEKDRAKYVIAHSALRHILAGYLELDPSQLEFREGAYGKPELVSTPQGEPLNFNLSHSHEAALVAVTLERDIGIDIEYIKRDFQWQEVAERFFAPGEIARLRALPEEKQHRGFFTCWTRKEAYIKAKGGGLSIPLQDFEVSLFPDEPASLISCISDPEETTRWSLAEVDAGPDYAAAVAVQGHGWRLKCWRWNENIGAGGGT